MGDTEADRYDRKGLIAASYNIDGISVEECRSIFLDWALSLPEGAVTAEAIGVMLDRHGAGAPDHPMTGVLREGLGAVPPARRRGGRAGRAQ